MTIQLPVVGTALAALMVAAVVALITTPIVRTLAFKVGAVDVPKDARRMHKHPIPRMGGLAIFFGFILSTLVFMPLTEQLRGMLLGAVLIVILGIFDDIYALPAKPKFLVQIVAATIAAMSGNCVEFLSNPNIFSSEPYWELGWLSIPFSVFWIVGITNAVNLIDGLDGLACGVSTISSTTLLVIALTVAEPEVAILMAALSGACVGFLPYNLNPAKIFMGDSGSLALGALFASLGILSDCTIALFFIGGVFVIEMFCVVVQQVSVRLFHKRVFSYTPIHYAFIKKGMGERQVVRMFWLCEACLALIGLWIGLH